MFRLTLRGLARHRLRLVATALSVLLGVGFVAGTFVLTDTIRASLQSLLGQGGKEIAVVVQARSAVSSASSSLASGPPLSEAMVNRVRAIPGVAAAEGQVIGFAELITPDGKPIGSSLAPSFGISVGTVPALRVLTLRSGRFPSHPGEVVVDVATVQSQHYHLGSTVRVAGNGPVRRFTLVGVVGYGTANNLAGATIVGFDLSTAQSVTGHTGQVQSVLVAARPGISSQALAARIGSVLGRDYQVQTGAHYQQQNSNNLTKQFAFFAAALLIFAGVALFVGAFIIFNTFSIVVAQRSRELALLRCLGAFRRQLLVMVLAESGVVGLMSSVVGLAFGVLLAVGLRGVLQLLSVDLPTATPVILPRTVIVSLVVGTVVTMAAATVPAIRASRSSPLAALRDGTASDVRSSTRFRVVLGTVLAIGGLAAIGNGLFGHGLFGHGRVASYGGAVGQSGAGVVVIFLAMSALGPVLARPLSGAIGRPFARLLRVPGRLARANAMRHPQRTSSTAAALMIGLSLVTVVAVFSQTIKVSIASTLSNRLTADAIVAPVHAVSSTFTTAVATRLAADRRFTSVTGLAAGDAMLVGLPGSPRSAGLGEYDVTGVAVAAYRRDVVLTVRSGHLTALDRATDTVAVTDTFASAHHVVVGEAIPLTFPTSGTRRLRVVAIFHDPTHLATDLLMSDAGFAVAYPRTRVDTAVVLRWAQGVSPASGLRALNGVLRQFPQVTGEARATYIAGQQANVNQLVALVTALLALAVIIALFGIVNTLALSIVERTREIGLLRILGLSRRQLRSMVRWESVIIALLGSMLGVAIGLGIAWVLVRALRSKRLTDFAVPWWLVGGIVVAAGLAGILAAVVPARRASAIDMLAAIAVE